MISSPHTRSATVSPFPHLHRVGAIAAALTVMAVGLLVLIGWWLDVTALKSIVPGLAMMKFNTALGFLLAGLALWWLRAEPSGQRRRYAGQACAALVALLGLLTLAEHLGGWDLGIDNRLFAEPAATSKTLEPGRMAPVTAFNFLGCGLALLLLDWITRRGRRPAQFIVLLPLVGSYVALIGYLYDVEALYAVTPYSSMALHTAAAFVVLGAGILWARPEHGWMARLTGDMLGGVLLRRLLPAILLGMPLLGGLELLGERAGLYLTPFGLNLLVLASVLFLVGVVWWSAESLNRADSNRRRAEAARRQSDDLLRGFFDHAEGIVWIKDLDGRFLAVNRYLEQVLGRTREEILGRSAAELFQSAEAAAFADNDQQVLISGQSIVFEETVTLADGPHPSAR